GALVALFVLNVIGLFALKFVPHAWVQAIWLLPLLAVEIVAAIVMGVLIWRLRNVDIANNFREVALPFLAVLKQDIDRDQTVFVRIDLRDPFHASKLKRTSSPYVDGAYHKVIDTTYLDPWFHGKAQLADGSRLAWTVYDTIIKSARTKRT